MSSQNNQQQEGVDAGRIQTVLIHHWATMVDEQANTIREYQRQLEAVEERANRIYQDNVVLHGLINESYNETRMHERLSLAMSALVLRILRENPEAVQGTYRDEYLAAINDFNGANPIDLTADENLDEAL